MSDDAKDPEMDAEMDSAHYPPHIAALLDDARPLDVVSDAVKSAVKARVMGTVSAASIAPAPNASAAAAGSSTAKLWLGLALGGALIAALLLARRPGPAQPRSNAAATVASVVAPISVVASADAAASAPGPANTAVLAPVVTEDSGAASVVASSEPVAPPRRVAPEQESPDTLEAEYRLVNGARERLGAHDARGALALLATHGQRYARGSLSMEREALRVRALLMEERRDEARTVAQRFVARWPSSALRATVEAMVR